MTIFVDTSIWYAAADSSDRSRRAKTVPKSVEVFSDHVLAETWTLFHHRVTASIDERFWDGLRSDRV